MINQDATKFVFKIGKLQAKTSTMPQN